MTDQAPPAVTPVVPVPAGVPPRSPFWPEWVRDVLALASTAIFAGVLFVAAFRKDVAFDGDLKGAAIMQWALVMGFYFGSSKSSASKDATIATMAKTGDGQ